jgi:hypothetical protein
MTSSHRPTRPVDPGADADLNRPQAEKEGLDLSVPKIAGGALAAVTTAVAASFLGVNGTLTGAAFGSVISSIAAAIYASSLKHAGKKIRTTSSVVLRTGAPGEPTTVAVIDPNDPTSVPPELTGHSRPLPGETEVLAPAMPRHRSVWKPVLLMSVLAFVVGMAVVSLGELALGHPFGNSKDSGTSIGTAVRGGEPAETTTSTTETSSPTDSPSDSPSASDSGTATSDSTTGQPSDTGQGSASPSGSGQATGTPAPTGSPAPSDAASGGAGNG